MKYLIEATEKEKGITTVITIPTEIAGDGEREDIAIVFDLGNGKTWLIPISELDHLVFIVGGLVD